MKRIYRRKTCRVVYFLVLMLIVSSRVWFALLYLGRTKMHHQQEYRGRIFYCGYRNQLFKYVFPDYEFMGDSEWALPEGKENDILVVGLHGPGCNRGKGDERSSFAGKILYVNNEPNGDPVQEKYDGDLANKITTKEVYQIGPYPKPKQRQQQSDKSNSRFFEKSDHSLQVYQTAISFLESIYLPTHNYDVEFKATDVDPFMTTSNEETISVSVSISKSKSNINSNIHQQWNENDKPKGNRNNNNPSVLDPWKQLVQGSNDFDFIGASSHEQRQHQPRIPAVVYVSKNCVSYRQKAAELLAVAFQDLARESRKNDDDNYDTNNSNPSSEARIKMVEKDSFVHYGGSCTVNGGIPVPPTVLGEWKNTERSQFQTNYQTIYTRYKYCLVMENTKKKGYITEKLMHGLLGGCLPIYYGTREVFKIFRNDAFIYFDIENPQPALDQIRRLENDHDEYLRMTNQSLPLLKVSAGDNISSNHSTATTVDDYFSLLPNIGTGKLCRQIYEMMGLPLPESLANKK